MPFERIQSEKVSQLVVRQIELLILRGILQPGERLPSERELSERMGVSRPSLRDAVAALQEAGLLVCRANAGIFVAEVLGSTFSPGLIRLFGKHEEAVFDYLDFRCDLEGLAAERAARLGSESDLAVVNNAFARMEAEDGKRTPKHEADLDAAFHLAIVEASHNVVMLHMMRSMYDLLQQGVFYNRKIMFQQRTKRSSLLDQHRDINAAIQLRDAEAARRAIEDHIAFVRNALTDQLKADKNETIARKRLAFENQR
ncbi:MAG: FCD domain-containing protein [Silicimonas sp.]|nr:FCD domain-containing protein [Silicimonas sp.]